MLLTAVFANFILLKPYWHHHVVINLSNMVKDEILYFLYLVAILTKLYHDFYLSTNDLRMLVTAIISLTSIIHWYATQSIHYIRHPDHICLIKDISNNVVPNSKGKKWFRRHSIQIGHMGHIQITKRFLLLLVIVLAQ